MHIALPSCIYVWKKMASEGAATILILLKWKQFLHLFESMNQYSKFPYQKCFCQGIIMCSAGIVANNFKITKCTLKM